MAEGAEGEHLALGVRLTRSSTKFAQSALSAMSDGEHAQCLLHAATALEHLAKAVLADVHPSLIAVAGRDNFDSLLILAGHAPVDAGAKVRTIGARQAIERAGRFAPECAVLAKELEPLIAVRDGVVHLADASAARVEDVLVPYLRASEALRERLGVGRADYWGPFAPLVYSALRESVEQARLRVDAKLTVALGDFERRFVEVDDETKAAVVSAIEASYTPDKYEEQLAECPACGTLALVGGTLTVEYDEDWDDAEERGGLPDVHALVRFTPVDLLCRACQLVLTGREEMDAAGVGESEYIDVEGDFFGEPYEDW